MDIKEYISIQDGIIVIIALMFYDLLNLLLSEDCCEEREIGRVTGGGEVQTLFFRIKGVV